MSFFSSLLSHFRAKFHPRSSHVNFMESKTFPPDLHDLSTKTLVFDVEGGLLRSSSAFPYFMLVALEGGGFLRGLLLLLLYPLLTCCLSQEMGIRVMAMVSFCGLRKEGFRNVGRGVLPKHLLEDVGLEGFEVMRRGRRRVCVSRMPRVMVEGFLKDYLEVEVVVGRELKVVGGFYTGLLEEDEEFKVEEEAEEEDQNNGGGGFIGVFSPAPPKGFQVTPFSQCKEIYMVTEAEKKKWHPLPRQKYPKPLIFHDGRLAFKPNFINTTSMFLWLPFALPLSILRLFVGILLPYKLSTIILSFTSQKYKLRGSIPPYLRKNAHLFVCNHRTLIDAIQISIALNRPVTAVEYSLSRISKILSPIRTVQLTRNREKDGEIMRKLLSLGNDVVVCPEGTTCREPYLLRFSPLFVELTNEVVPVAVKVKVSMFYGTTASGFKGFDPFYYLMNPSMCYELEFLEKIDTNSSMVGGGSSIEKANFVQEVIGKALRFQCTKFTRKDKYMMLAGNGGILK